MNIRTWLFTTAIIAFVFFNYGCKNRQRPTIKFELEGGARYERLDGTPSEKAVLSVYFVTNLFQEDSLNVNAAINHIQEIRKKYEWKGHTMTSYFNADLYIVEDDGYELLFTLWIFPNGEVRVFRDGKDRDKKLQSLINEIIIYGKMEQVTWWSEDDESVHEDKFYFPAGNSVPFAAKSNSK